MKGNNNALVPYRLVDKIIETRKSVEDFSKKHNISIDGAAKVLLDAEGIIPPEMSDYYGYPYVIRKGDVVNPE